MTRWKKWAAAIALLLVATAVAAAIWWRSPSDPVTELRRRTLHATALVREPAAVHGNGIERWRIATAAGDTFLALWRPAPAGIERPWTILLMGGLGTGDRAATLLPARLPAHVLALDWPWRGPRKLTTLDALRQLGAIREAVLRSPAVFALGVEVAAAQPEVDRIAVVGASLGAPTAIAALRLTDKPAALVLVDGFADLRRVLEHALRRTVRPAALAPPLAAYAARLLDPVEPSHHAAHAAAIPALLLNARDDERIPIAAIERLWGSLPEADKRWREGMHLRAHRNELIAALSDEVWAWLESLGESGRSAPPPTSSSPQAVPRF